MGLNLNNPSLFRQDCFIDGQWVQADSGAVQDVTNPADQSVLGTIPTMAADETRRAIDAANEAFKTWRYTSPLERSAILRKWADLMMENQDDLGRLMTLEQGKPLAEAKGEVAYAASFFYWFAEEARRVYGETIPANTGDRRLVTIRQPVGVIAAITPWNFPAAMITRKLGPAIAVGCTSVIKPAAETPYSAFALAVLAEEAGLPKGVMNVVTGKSAPIGQEMCANPIVRKVTFTGSTEVGKILLKQSADTVKKVSMELGGNAPFLVFDDADIDAAVEGAMISKYRNTGQTCVCANRILVQEGVYDEFAAKLKEKVEALQIGSGLDAGVTQGPLIDEKAVQKVEAHVADAIAKGGKVLTGGQRHGNEGTFYQPTIIANATRDMACFSEETFGPMAPLIRFKTEEEAIEMANDSEFGLAAYFYSRDIGRAWRVGEALESGMVGINTGLISTAEAPFGGVKESGLGREGARQGIDDYLETKYLCMAGV